ncbi:MAG: hypothetical protein AB8F94_00535 [Saprospiraceae bacterium]
MKLSIQIILIILIGFGCNGNSKAKVENENKEKIQRDTYVMTKEDIATEEFYGLDTLMIKEYKSENGHQIKLEGSKSKNTYRISVKSNKGFSKKFQITENSYIAMHSSILWDNENYLFVKFGCGTSCWGGQILPLNKDKEAKIFMNHLYQDSIRNIIVYPDTSNYKTIILENFDNDKSISLTLDLCEETATPIDYIDCYLEEEKYIVFKYKKADCEKVIKKKVSIEKIKS